MHKIFTIAAAVSVMALSLKNNAPALNNLTQQQLSIFPFKNTSTNNFWEPEKKTAEPWSKNWEGNAQENIRKSEYHFKWEEKLKAYCTPNRKNNLRFFYNDKGFTAQPRTTKIPIGDFDALQRPEEIKYKSIADWKVKFNLDKKQVGKGTWQVTGNKAEYITDNITVQYINSDEGMRQNFVVHSPLAKNNKLKINFSVQTKLKTILHENRLQFYHKKINVLSYEQLKVWDATGRILESSIKKNKKNKFYIEVDAKDAVYPITVDPLSTIPAATLQKDQPNAALGWSVASAGDVNGDGYSDVIVGAPGYNVVGNDEGAAFIYHGSATGISNVSAATLINGQDTSAFGFSVATAGDVNGDGYSDVIVGSNYYDNGEHNEGAFYVFHGSAGGINTTAATFVESNQALAQLGFSVNNAGDINGDGYSDIIAGSWLYDDGQANEGAAFVYLGSASGVNIGSPSILQENQAGSNYGISVACAGDVNGDGFSDIIVGAEDYDDGSADEGVAFIYHGTAAGINTVAAASMQADQTLSQYGFAVSSAGDVNGDGYSDVIVGAYLFSNGEPSEGAAFIYHGSASGINTTVATFLESNQNIASLGASVACAGDINGDGYSDVIAGAYNYHNGQNSEGACYVFFGSATGVNATPAAIIESNQAFAQMGRGIRSAGDVNGDGYSDIIVGAYMYDDFENNEGSAFVYHGSAAGISIVPGGSGEGNLPDIRLGYSVAGAGDVNADGYSDVIMGALLYDNGEVDEGAAFVYYGSATGIAAVPDIVLESNFAGAYYGGAVAGAGDINGDGYADIIVGAEQYSSGQATEGAFYIYHGSASGINPIAAALVQSNQTGGNMAVSVSGAGDVNADGYADIIVGAWRYDNPTLDEGAAFVYLGSSSGLVTAAATMLESNQASAFFGHSVAGAGDVNGDGFSDVIVGATLYDNGQADEGAAFIYYGSATGVNTTAAAILDNNQGNAQMGKSVDGAGDINGDGYADVVVGSWFYDNGETDEGAAFVYLGSAAGIMNGTHTLIESNQANALLGNSVSAAGDVNGDGYSDIIVGALVYDNGDIDEGVAFVYHGTATGINATAAAILEMNQSGSNMGFSVSGAGDVNGDGYSDVIAGAWTYTNGDFLEGAGFVYHGNSPGTNTRNNLRMYNTDLTTPINSTNFMMANFGAGLYAKSFLGRNKGKLVWETRLNYDPYSGVPITNSTLFTAQQAAYTDLSLTGAELKNIINKILGSSRYTKLRARVKYNPATAITGQVYGPWRNASTVIDGNSLGALPIELISFNAAWLQKGKTAQISFVTDKENGICCFDIEKSADGFNFHPIGSIAARNTAGRQTYHFIDNNANAKSQYYRLKIKGMMGQTDYSNMQQLQYNASTEILVFPNPATNVLQLRLNGTYNNMDIQIINSAGQIVKQLNKYIVLNQTITLPINNLPAGRYWLKLQSGAERQLLQFVKQ